MADNVSITPGTGKDVATDEITGTLEHAQIVKLAISTDGSRTLIPADATNGIDVDVTRVSGTVAVSIAAGATTTAKAEDSASANADVGVPSMAVRKATPANTSDTDGDYEILQMAAGRLWVDASGPTLTVGAHAVTNAGTFATQVDGAALTALQLIDDPVVADDAAFTLGTGKVGMVGGAVVAHGSNPDAADAGDAGAFLMNRHRVQFVMGGHPNIQTTTLNITTAQTDVSLVGTIASGTKVVCTGFQFTVDAASTVFPKVTLGFGATNTPATAGVIGAHGGVPAGGGFGRGDGSGIVGIGADGEELRVTTVGTIGGNGGYMTVSWYTIES